MKYTIKLNIDIPIFKSNLHPVEVLKTIPAWADNVISNPPMASHFTLPDEYLSTEIKDFFIHQKQYIAVVEIFYMVPNGSVAIHIDDTEPGDFTKINWIFGGKNSKMIWYERKDSSKKAALASSYRNTGALHFTKDEVTEMHREYLQGPNLLQVGCPHTVVNGSEERFCVGVVFKNDKTTNVWNRPTMEESIEIFKDYT
jgi:hypothetical protein